MSTPTLIGMHGYKHAGKDTTYDRLAELGGKQFQQFSVADPMKESISALTEISVPRLDELKNDPDSFVKIGGRGEPSQTGPGAFMARYDSVMTMRRFMERYGTQAHRGVFGDDFWLDFWLAQVEARQRLVTSLMGEPCTFVNTSVRFPNEAEAILERHGEIWLIVGTDEVEETGRNARDENGDPIPSELRLPDHLITRSIDNSHRDPEFAESDPLHANLDDQIALILDEWRSA